ncbi:MAG: MFS transporter [Nitrososphaerota archaeon]|nr:MFS transporter [Nitrososphaerota archaeon]
MENLQAEIRRNSRILMTHQAIMSLTIQSIVALGPLAMFEMTRSPVLSGLVSAITWGGRLSVVVQSGLLMDRLGRKKVLAMGVLPACLGPLIVSWAALNGDLLTMVIGLGATGVGVGIAMQNRVAMTDMYPSHQRAYAVGVLYTASIIGSIVAPFITWVAESLTHSIALKPFVTVWLICAALVAVSLPVVLSMRLDPKDIARLVDNPRSVQMESDRFDAARDASAVQILPLVAVFVSSATSQGNMVMMMGLASLYLFDLGYSQTLVSLAVTIHVIGMFGFSTVLGRLSDSIGRRAVLVAGLLLSGVGSLIIPSTGDHLVVDAGMFLIGLGWSASIVSSTALISELVPVGVKGKYFGLNDMVLGISSLALPLIGGVMITSHGFFYLGLLGLVVALAPIPLLWERIGLYRLGPQKVKLDT